MNKLKLYLPKDSVYKDIPPYLAFAFSLIGTMEIKGKKSNPIIDDMLATVGMPSDDDIPWCSADINYCLIQTGFRGTNKANARSFLSYGVKIATPIFGCIAVYSRGDPTGWKGHVAFYLDQEGGHDIVIGGNQDNRHGIDFYQRDRLLGYRLPVLVKSTPNAQIDLFKKEQV